MLQSKKNWLQIKWPSSNGLASVYSRTSQLWHSGRMGSVILPRHVVAGAVPCILGICRIPGLYPPEASSSYSLPRPKFWQPHMSPDSPQQWGTVGIQEEGAAFCSCGNTFIELSITGRKNLRSSFAEGHQKLLNTLTIKVTDRLLTLWIKVAGEINSTITLYGEMTWLWLLFSCFSPHFGLSVSQWQSHEVLQLIFTSCIMTFFPFFSLFFSSLRHKR